jgi:hypothetical protein
MSLDRESRSSGGSSVDAAIQAASQRGAARPVAGSASSAGTAAPRRTAPRLNRATSAALRWTAPGARLRALARDLRRQSPAWLASTALHAVLLVVLGLWMLPDLQTRLREVIATTVRDDEDVAPRDILPADPFHEAQLADTAHDVSAPAFSDSIADALELSPLEEAPAPALSVDVDDLGIETVPKSELTSEIGVLGGRGLEGRGAAARKILVAQRGGNVASEEAVELALNWFLEHQNPDGSWGFDHQQAPACQGQCGDPGGLRGRIGATALALLPFLGAGQTHKRGKYAAQVEAGLEYLLTSMKLGPHGGDLRDDGNMYSHGLAAIALCEAYALTKDARLLPAAQQAILFIAYAQDKTGGGWRYQPHQEGDTSVTGWQLMALKSAHMAYLAVPVESVEATSRFLDSVAAGDGYAYGYMDKSARPGTTAVGLLCRMYLGWRRDKEALVRGIKYLSDRGPSRSDFYYNYYATQVLAHFEGEPWQKWNRAMRDYLIQSQSKQGHEAGSWFIADDPHGAKPGGRLYMTSMACMTLEVYYRHLPLYREESTKGAFE